MKKILIIIIIIISCFGCASIDQNRPKKKGWLNTVVYGTLLIGGLIAGNQCL